MNIPQTPARKQSWDAVKAAARADPDTEPKFSPAAETANSPTRSPLAAAIGPLGAAGYGPYLRPTSSPGVTVLYKDGPKISDGKIPNLWNGAAWTGWPKWPEYRPSEDDPQRWKTWPDAGLALVTGDIAAYDIDIKVGDGDRSEAADRARSLISAIEAIIARAAGVESIDQLPVRTRPGSSSRAILVRADEKFRKKKVYITDPATGTEFAVERLASGQQVVIAGKHPSGEHVHCPLADFPFADLPSISAKAAHEVLIEIKDEAVRRGFHASFDTARAGKPHEKRTGPLTPAEKVKRAIMARRAEWVPQVVPCQLGAPDAEWSVQSSDDRFGLDRPLDERLCIYPDGIYDFGTERPHTPISLICEFGQIEETGNISFGGCPDYGPDDDVPFAVVGDIEGVRRPTEAQAATWLCRQLGDPQMKALPANTTQAGAMPALARAVGLDWDVLGDEEAARHFESASGTDSDDEPRARPLITIRAGDLAAIASDAEAALIAAGAPFYSRSGAIVRPFDEELPATRGRTATVPRTVKVNKDGVTDHLARVADWQKFDRRSKNMVHADPPKQVAEVILSRDGEWRFPKLAGVITTPTLRPDYSVLSEPGYDPATGLLLLKPPRMPVIPRKPSREHALQGIALLQGLLEGFSFVSEADRSVALSVLMTPVVRGAMTSAPLHAVRAPTPGSGKSYLTDLAAAISTGQPCPVIAPHPDEKEVEKRLGAALLGAQPLVSIDNLNGTLSGDALCQIVERPVVQVRVLGKSELVRIENKATILATGNNLQLAGDLVRRTVVCTLDTGEERPELRQFNDRPFDTVLADRGKYVAAVLTIVLAYIEAGFPERRRDLASFEEWSRLVRSSLVWLGCADPADTMEAARAEDPILSNLSAVMNAWCAAVGLDIPLSAGDLKERADAHTHPELRAALMTVAGDRSTIDTRKLGIWLGKHKGRIVSSLKFVAEEDKHAKQKVWLLKSAGSAGICGHLPHPSLETVRLEDTNVVTHDSSIERVENPPAYTRGLPPEKWSSLK